MNDESNEDVTVTKNQCSTKLSKNENCEDRDEEIEVEKQVKRKENAYEYYPKRRRLELSSDSSSESEDEKEKENSSNDKMQQNDENNVEKQQNIIKMNEKINESTKSIALSIREKLKMKNGYKPQNIKFEDKSKEVNISINNLNMKTKEKLSSMPKIINRVISEGLDKERVMKSEKELQYHLLSRQLGKNWKPKPKK